MASHRQSLRHAQLLRLEDLHRLGQHIRAHHPPPRLRAAHRRAQLRAGGAGPPRQAQPHLQRPPHAADGRRGARVEQERGHRAVGPAPPRAPPHVPPLPGLARESRAAPRHGRARDAPLRAARARAAGGIRAAYPPNGGCDYPHDLAWVRDQGARRPVHRRGGQGDGPLRRVDEARSVPRRHVPDPCVRRAPSVLLTPTVFAVRFVPEWFPGGGWKKIAREWLVDMDAMVDLPHAYVKDRMADGTALPSFTSFYMLNGQVSAEEEDNIKWASSSIMAGGSDTSVSSIHSFFLAMMLYPEVQRKAQAELDAIVGRDRLPSLGDSEQLPYVNALVKEVFRWNPVGPVGLPHRLMEDDEYEGYHIPKGSIVFANIWKFLHDEEVYHDPLEFIPDRFIASEGKEAEFDPHGFSFGFGRRVCPGMFLADLSVFSACAMILAAFDISKAVENGVTIEPKVEYTDGSISHPKPFKCSIKPRSEQAVSLVSSVRFSDEE